MLKKIAATAALAGAMALSVASPALVSAVLANNSFVAIGDLANPMFTPQAVGNWPDPM